MNLIKNKGITLIEIIIVIVIISILSSIVLINLSKFRNEQALRNTVIDITSLLNKARQNTLSSINSTNYSIRFKQGRVILFTGSVYSSTDPNNEIIIFNPAVNISTTDGINIPGGGVDITFERLTGDTIGGTIVVQLVSDSTKKRTINISKTGVISAN